MRRCECSRELPVGASVCEACRKRDRRGGRRFACGSPCSDEEFVRIWQSASTPAEAARRAGYRTKKATEIACHRAMRLRQRGVALKSFRRRTDVDALNALLEGTS
jgi:hypothetical protein